MRDLEFRPTADQAGYSLVELLVTMVVSVVLVGGLYSVLFSSQATYKSQQDQTALRQQARVAVGRLADDLRMAGYNLGTAPERLMYAGTTQISFAADIDDGSATAPCGNAIESAVGGGAERVRYRLQGTSLLRSIDCWDGAAWGTEYTDLVVSIDVQNTRAIFRYFDEDGTELSPGGGTLSATNRDLVRVVRINLDLTDMGEDQVLGDRYVDFELRTSVRLRNAGF